MDIAFILVFVFVFLCSYFVFSRPKGLPPGPWSLPLIGSYLFLKKIKGKSTYLEFLEASKEYGKIFSFRIGSQLMVTTLSTRRLLSKDPSSVIDPSCCRVFKGQLL